MAAELITPLYDTPSDSQVSVSVDVGIIPQNYRYAGRYVVTLQAWPIAKRADADALCRAIVEAVNARLGIRMEVQYGETVDAALDRRVS